MAIKRGVSLYSYQQTQFFKELDWKGQILEVHDNLKTDGIEIINMQTIRDYPFPSQEFIYDWNSFMARYDMKAVTMDVYFDVMRFRDHVMNFKECAELLKIDIKIAAEMGFENIRCLSAVPVEVLEMCIPAAEKYNVRLGTEIHFPGEIKHHDDDNADPMFRRMSSDKFQKIMALADRYQTKYIGLVPDFGIFQHSCQQTRVDFVKRHLKNPDIADFILENRWDYSIAEMTKLIEEKYPDEMIDHFEMESLMLKQSSSRVEDLREIVPYIVSMHGKFYQMTEIEGEPGHYEDKCIDYAGPIKILKEEGFDGYINSEYEGQREQQDRGIEFLPSEIEEVRRHHEMLQRLYDTV